MPRKDGRIEKGQSIRSAISARAWNRAQDAADIVLGASLGIEAGEAIRQSRALYLKATISQTSPFRHTRFGMICVRRFVDNLPTNYEQTGQEVPFNPGLPHYRLSHAVPFVDRRQTAHESFAVLSSGVMLPAQVGLGAVATVCTHGTTIAMVRKNPGGWLPRIRPAVIRYPSDTAANLRGIAEDSDCGAGELVLWTNIKPFETQRQTNEGISPIEALDPTLDSVYYAVVRL